jgi:FtsP/CotA-like multicopper oxidase with cupredoxin domain
MAIAGCVWLCLSHGLTATAQPSLQPDSWDADLRLPEAMDVNADPHVVEITLEARVARIEIAADRSLEAWTYGGSVPGPLIRARVGDRLIVHFVNRLPQATTVHWHGLRVPIQMDGVPEHSQPEVKPGESFTYDFLLPDAGLFWYHPHVMSAAQVGFGLYGALLVEDPQDTVGVADQLVLVLSDIELAPAGELESPDVGGSAGMAFGREGNHVLINGREGRRLLARSDAPERWRVVNAAKSRYFELELDGQRFRRVGGDGGLLEYSTTSDTIVLAPGERADLVVSPRGNPGTDLLLRSLLYNRGYGSVETRLPFDELMTIRFADLPAYRGAQPPDTHRVIEPLDIGGATRVSLELSIAQSADGNFEYRVNGKPFARHAPIKATPGETQVWTIKNTTKWSHPFHIHGFFFQALDERDRPIHPLAWKDTIDVPFEKTARLAVRFEDRPGMWMYHCHILDHADGGLMGMIELGPGHH